MLYSFLSFLVQSVLNFSVFNVITRICFGRSSGSGGHFLNSIGVRWLAATRLWKFDTMMMCLNHIDTNLSLFWHFVSAFITFFTCLHQLYSYINKLKKLYNACRSIYSCHWQKSSCFCWAETRVSVVPSVVFISIDQSAARRHEHSAAFSSKLAFHSQKSHSYKQ